MGKHSEHDLILVGGGAAGFAAAIRANDLKTRTLMVNDNSIGLGGTCVNVGCVPTKYFLNLTEIIDMSSKQEFKGLDTSASFDFKEIHKAKDEFVTRMRTDKYEKVLEGLEHVSLVEGRAEFTSKTEVKVGGESFSASSFVVSTGSSTYAPPIKGLDKVEYLTNLSILQMKELPSSLIVHGAGPLALEFAQMYSRFGVDVTVIQRSNRILTREEPEVANFLQRYLKAEGIKIFTGVEVTDIYTEGEEKVLNSFVREEEQTFKAEKLLIATGRRANTSGLGLEKIGVKLGERGEITVNDEMQAGTNVWAAGDVTGEPMLETVAAREGMIASHNALSEGDKMKMDYRVIPRAVFTDPQVGSVGMTDVQVNGAGIRCTCNTVPIELIPKAKLINATKGVIKMVLNNETQEILGIHILAKGAADLIHEGVMIIKNRMKIDDVIDTVHIFPTLSEAMKLAAQSFKRDITKMSCCAE